MGDSDRVQRHKDPACRRRNSIAPRYRLANPSRTVILWIAYLIDEAGVVIKDVAVGTDAILELMTQTEKPEPERMQEVTCI